MDILTIVILLVLGFVVLWVAAWIIDKFFPADLQVPVKVLVGLVALIALAAQLTGHGIALPRWHR